jgi:hypothetical protein
MRDGVAAVQLIENRQVGTDVDRRLDTPADLMVIIRPTRSMSSTSRNREDLLRDARVAPAAVSGRGVTTRDENDVTTTMRESCRPQGEYIPAAEAV